MKISEARKIYNTQKSDAPGTMYVSERIKSVDFRVGKPFCYLIVKDKYNGSNTVILEARVARLESD